jgi:single-stranded-DNA-specific exonuclease
MKKRWKVNPANKELQEELVKTLDILPLTAQLLINRGLVDRDKAFSFLSPDLKDLHDPFLLKDMGKAVNRLSEALAQGEGIAVYGDYDVDGTTSTALLHLFFKDLGVTTLTHIPDRVTEGYGLNIDALKDLSLSGVKVVITVDCGSTDHEEIRYANKLGMDVIVTDHHELPDGPPPAFAVINPKQNGCQFPFKGLAGVGVAFNLVMALRAHLRKSGWFKDNEPNLKRYLDLVSIGTVSDMVPLVDENRVFVSLGLKVLANTARPGLKALKEAAGVKPGRVDAYNIAFGLGPRINAAGRVAQASIALDLLVTGDYAKAKALASKLERENSARRRLEAEILKDAISMVDAASVDHDMGIVLSSEAWHPGVIGIVASRLVERYSKPAVMIALGADVGKGSARGIRSFNMVEGLKACESLLVRFGGHKAAAGLTVKRADLDAFRTLFMKHINATLTDDDLVPMLDLDATVTLDDIDLRLVSELGALSPFGVANREPLLCLEDAHIMETRVVKEKHLRFKLARNGRALSAIGFGLAALHPIEGDGFALAFTPYLDEWGGGKRMSLKIKDVQPHPVNFLTCQ